MNIWYTQTERLEKYLSEREQTIDTFINYWWFTKKEIAIINQLEWEEKVKKIFELFNWSI